MTPDQCKTARMLLEWSQEQLAKQADVDVYGVRLFEDTSVPVRKEILDKIHATLEEAGVTFEANGDVTSNVLIGRSVELK